LIEFKVRSKNMIELDRIQRSIKKSDRIGSNSKIDQKKRSNLIEFKVRSRITIEFDRIEEKKGIFQGYINIFMYNLKDKCLFSLNKAYSKVIIP